ncbi:MAG: adenosylmethionine decarboxylase [Gammaproteobacteria bacterium]|nr:adenosylmethionine decarboxylase [Gammaproteobacteria bacterium]
MSRDPSTGPVAAGRHVIIECFGGQADFDAATMEALLRQAAAAGGACVLSCHMHRFGADSGVTGVALLAQSHITVHTWPERNYAAFDVFMCGDCDADQAAEAIARAVPGTRVTVRGVDRPTSADWRD